jgi:hypothetical protein
MKLSFGPSIWLSRHLLHDVFETWCETSAAGAVLCDDVIGLLTNRLLHVTGVASEKAAHASLIMVQNKMPAVEF